MKIRKPMAIQPSTVRRCLVRSRATRPTMRTMLTTGPTSSRTVGNSAARDVEEVEPPDAMFAATDTNFAPWRVAPSDRKKSVRLNIISDILKRVPYKELPREKLKLPPRQKAGDYVDPDQLRKVIEQRY